MWITYIVEPIRRRTAPQSTQCSLSVRPEGPVRHHRKHTANTEFRGFSFIENLVVFRQLIDRSPSLHACRTHPSSASSLCTLQRHDVDDYRRVAQMRVRVHIAWLAIRALVKLADPRQFGRQACLALIW